MIPHVILRAPQFHKEFWNVAVTLHNMGRDLFQLNVFTALDVILSLVDQRLIPHAFLWYTSIGTAQIVNGY